MPTWKQLEAAGKVRGHKTSAAEIETHLAVVKRYLSDAAVPQLSDDGRYLMAYSAAFQLATIALFASGYEPRGDDHHERTFSALPLALGTSYTMLADYFDLCRRKRNNIQYDKVNVATKAEADELFTKVSEFAIDVVLWLAKTHPKLTPADRAG